MKLSYFTMPLHPPARDYRETLREDREAILLADRLGFSEAFIGEHATDRAETVTSCLMFIASLVHETKQIKLGSGTVNMPNIHPVATASQVAMIDHMLDGRFLFGISPGGLLSDAEAFGNLDKDRGAMFVEAIDHVLGIWSGQAPYDREGAFWSISTRRKMDLEIGQGIIMAPLQKPHPPIVVTVMSPFSKSATRAGARGWTIISANFLMTPWVASHWKMYEEGCAGIGRRADRADWRVARTIFVADDEATAQRYGKGPDAPYRFYYKQLMRKLIGNGRPELFKEDRAMPDDAITLDYVLDRLVVCGTVESVVEQLLAFRGRIGDFGTLVYAGMDWVDARLACRSMELMATEVMPRLNRAIEEGAA
jgi:alkanesulfonate monooxygenase SsuD/methylene tetrahydromethanopterin reductase-like flavin-dependent oxidoreductase (luciferase family)